MGLLSYLQLIRQLKSGDLRSTRDGLIPRVNERIEALDGLNNLGGWWGLWPVARTACWDREPRVQAAAIEMLIERKDPRAMSYIDRIVNGMRRPSTEYWRVAAARQEYVACLLGKVKSPRSVDLLVTLASHGEDLVRIAALQSLACVGNSGVVDELAHLLSGGVGRKVKLAAVATFRALGWRPPDAASRVQLATAAEDWDALVAEGEGAWDQIQSLLYAWDPSIMPEQGKFIQAVGSLGCSRFTPKLCIIAKNHKAPRPTRAAAIQAILEMPPVDSVEVLAGMLSWLADDSEFYLLVAQAILQRGAFDELGQSTESIDHRVASLACTALADSGDPRAIRQILRCRRDFADSMVGGLERLLAKCLSRASDEDLRVVASLEPKIRYDAIELSHIREGITHDEWITSGVTVVVDCSGPINTARAELAMREATK